MSHFRFLSFLVAALGWGLLLPPAARADETVTLSFQGMRRTAVVHVPPGFRKEGRYPLVLVFHGGGGNAPAMAGVTGFDAEADRGGFIVAYPQGSGPAMLGKAIGTWNAGSCCGSAMKKQVDDVGFVSRLLDELEARYSVDPHRVYATGLSNGGQMSYRLACELSDRIAAIAPVASQLELASCTPSRPVPLMHFHGKKDPCCLYGGGKCGGCFQTFFYELLGIHATGESTFTCPGVEDDVKSWSRRNGCTGEAEPVSTHGTAELSEVQGCPASGEVALWSIANMGHNWPGGNPTEACDKNPTGRTCRLFMQAVGPASNDISATQLMWEFFARHAM